MGYLLKEALKSICGVNQWSYAVFWKIGCQNPKLLIWEDCYYEVLPCSVLPSNTKIENQGLTLEELDTCWLSPEAYLNQLGAHVDERVDLLVKKMMANQVHVVGEGLVGRTAFTGNHQWIVSGYFNERIHPPEVVNEVQLQFSSGMQTVAVIPAIPHGVIQLGSPLTIMENTGFIHDVKNLILHLGCIPSALVSDNCVKDASIEGSGVPFTQVVPASFHPYMDGKKLNYSATSDGADKKNSFQDSQLDNQASHSISSKVQDNLKTAASFLSHNQNVSYQGNECQSSRNAEADSGLVFKGHLENKALRAEVTPLKPDTFLKCKTLYNPGSVPICGQSLLFPSDCSHNSLEKHIMSVAGYEECTQPSAASSIMVQSHLHSQFSEPYDGWISSARNVNFSNKVADGLSVMQAQPIGVGVSSSCSHPDDDMRQYNCIPDKHGEKDLYEGLNIALPNERDLVPSNGFLTGFTKIHNASKVSSRETGLSDINSSVEGDLFDVLGVEFKNKMLNGYAGNFSNVAGKNLINQMKSQDLTSAKYPDCNRISGSGKLSASGSDHLLDAMVSGAYSAATQISDDNISCKTTLTEASLSVPSSSLMFDQGSISQQMCELFDPSKTLARSQNDTGNCTQTSSFYGSHSSSWVEQGPNATHETSITTANSKKSGEVGKPNRKRIKPGENPRPRPKDRQMFQDRVKELREMVPNGAKCSLDALLEQTIKHMLFLQSVTQNADKLKQTVESKIINKDGGLLPKDKIEGGATWAYEVGSQGNVCPIVVEDLDAPRQLLVEMLCEERGFFLEIADIIRGMGLTILKGVMETRRDKIWARFVVEANRDVTRMEVCLSLVRLLEQTGKNNKKLQKDGSNNSNGVVHPTFDHTAAVSGGNLIPTDLQ